MKNVISYVPNLLTILRIVLVPLFLYLILYEKYFVSLALFGFIALTDFFDGYLARKWNVVSDFGRAVDPLADKILMISSYMLFAYLNYIPHYLCAVVVLKDVLILSVVIICRCKKIKLKISPIMSSKINTTIQLVYILLIIACKWLMINISSIIEVCSVIVCISTIFSFAEYTKKYFWIKDAVCK